MNNNPYEKTCVEIANNLIKDNRLSIKDINKLVKKTSLKYKLNRIPKNEHIIKLLPESSQYREMLKVKPVKTASGVAVITVLPKPSECPHGRCIYCPGGVEYNTPLSYIGTEPATKIAQALEYDPYHQVESKIQHLESRGHNITKAELVIVGGTFPFFDREYQRYFVKSCYDALNRENSSTLEESIKKNEIAKIRCVGFTLETKPDYCKSQHVDLMLDMGITRIEIGVQTLQNEIYKAVNRGHNLNDVVESFMISRNAGYKIVAHMMPGLPGSTPYKDIKDFKKLFYDEKFKPDMLKIYPTLVTRGTGLFKLYTAGKYKGYSDDDMINILVEIKKIVPPWIRIMRIQREIEPNDIIVGPKQGNLRQKIQERLQNLGIRCNCIRCREAGLQGKQIDDKDAIIDRMDYKASGGLETFLSILSSDKKNILGFLRLRNNHLDKKDTDKTESKYMKLLKNSSIVRELHIYGNLINVGKKQDGISFQHRGFGIQLLTEAENITKNEFNLDKISVISAVGTREYYKKSGYVKNGPYMSKVL